MFASLFLIFECKHLINMMSTCKEKFSIKFKKKLFILLNNNMNTNISELYELQCSNAIYDCIVLVMTPSMYLAKRKIIENFINLDISKYISNFKPYKSRLQLNIPLLQHNVCHYLYLILNQFYEFGPNKTYYIVENSEGTHEDIDDLVIKITTILSNKLLGKNIIKNIVPIDKNIVPIDHIDTITLYL